DPLALYNTNMGNPSPVQFGYGGITRSGSSGSYTYNAIVGRENMPVNYVTFYDALRFANWMNNGQGTGDTEMGAYRLVGGTPEPINFNSITRTAGATIFLSSENEWYKAAYYDPSASRYFDYPTSSDTPTNCGGPSATANLANCGGILGIAGDLTSVGS